MKLLRALYRCQSSFRASTLYSGLSIQVCRKNFSTTRLLAVDMETVNTTERLRKLRDLMKEHKVDVYSMSNSRSLN